MENDKVLSQFIDEIRHEFPDVSERIDKWMEHLGYDAESKMYTSMIEAFSQATTDAIKQFDKQPALSHLKYMSNKFKIASTIEQEYIDVFYVEPLMWDIRDKKTLKWGWGLIPDNLKALYKKMWGEPRF